jgi:hypothetical protein
MIWSRVDGWSITCDRCLAMFPPTPGTREEIIALITGPPHFWEMLDLADMCRCLVCSRAVREVPFPTNQRGVRRRRR